MIKAATLFIEGEFTSVPAEEKDSFLRFRDSNSGHLDPKSDARPLKLQRLQQKLVNTKVNKTQSGKSKHMHRRCLDDITALPQFSG